jgi:hypothetical protein
MHPGLPIGAEPVHVTFGSVVRQRALPFINEKLECRAMTVWALRWFKAALVLQIILVAYWLTIEVVALFPWNDLESLSADYDLRKAIALNALQLLAYTLIFALGIRLLAMISVAGYALYLAIQLWIWWKPFAMGADPAWQERYAQSFARTLKLIPSYGTHLAPDAQHIVLQLLTIATLVATVMAVARMRHL